MTDVPRKKLTFVAAVCVCGIFPSFHKSTDLVGMSIEVVPSTASPLTPISVGDIGLSRQGRVRPSRLGALPSTPELPLPGKFDYVSIRGSRIFYAQYGHGEPVILLHGGLANSNYWGHQIPALASNYTAIVIDLPGHGRSGPWAEPIGYYAMAADVVGVMNALHLRKAAIVGWSDGAIVGLAIAIRYPERITKLFAYGANFNTSGLIEGGSRTGAFAEFSARVAKEYENLSPHPQRFAALRASMNRLWRTEPSFSQAMLASIRCPTMIAGGQYDEIIKLHHTKALAAAIPSAQLLIEPDVSHFAMIQRPERFTVDVIEFLRRE